MRSTRRCGGHKHGPPRLPLRGCTAPRGGARPPWGGPAEVVMTTPLLEIRGLRVSFATRGGPFVAVDGIDLNVSANKTLAIVGESGSGKSVAMLAIMGLLPWTASVEAERMSFDGHDLRTLTKRQR